MNYRITVNDEFVAYSNNPKNFSDFMPDDTLLSFKTNGEHRRLIYPSGRYDIKPTSKKQGIYAGDICVICKVGEMVDMNGCSTCNRCGGSTKCGL